MIIIKDILRGKSLAGNFDCFHDFSILRTIFNNVQIMIYCVAL